SAVGAHISVVVHDHNSVTHGILAAVHGGLVHVPNKVPVVRQNALTNLSHSVCVRTQTGQAQRHRCGSRGVQPGSGVAHTILVGHKPQGVITRSIHGSEGVGIHPDVRLDTVDIGVVEDIGAGIVVVEVGGGVQISNVLCLHLVSGTQDINVLSIG